MSVHHAPCAHRLDLPLLHAAGHLPQFRGQFRFQVLRAVPGEDLAGPRRRPLFLQRQLLKVQPLLPHQRQAHLLQCEK